MPKVFFVKEPLFNSLKLTYLHELMCEFFCMFIVTCNYSTMYISGITLLRTNRMC